MRVVSRFEASLLRLLYCLFRRAPLEHAWPVFNKPPPRPACLSADTVGLVQGALAKGCVRLLAGWGWRRDRFLRGGRAVEGRLWERTPPAALGLTFSRASLEFLIQLTAGTLGKPQPDPAQVTVGDRFLFFLALDTFEKEVGQELRRRWAPLAQDGLARLSFLDTIHDEAGQGVPIDWAPWTGGVGACILEAMQDRLADAWVHLEHQKEGFVDVARMRRVGLTQRRVWGGFLDAVAAAGRRDLARCLLRAAWRVLRDQPAARQWIGQLNLKGERLADRVDIYLAALTLMQQVVRLHGWEQEARAVAFFDEGYAASQLWKADWERFHGDLCAARARAILAEVQPLKTS